MSNFGPTFAQELFAAGLGGLPFSWTPDDIIGAANLTPDQYQRLYAVIAVHNPLKKLVPETVTPLQARRAMRAAGIYEIVQAAVDVATDPDVSDSWEFADVWHRDAHWITALSAQLNLSSAQIDALFIQAAEL